MASPDDRFGERAAAVMRLHGDAAMPTLGEVQTHLGGIGLAKQKWPELLFEIDVFPRTPSGKIQKYRLRDDLRAGRAPGQSESA